MRILIVEDDRKLAEFVARGLRAERFAVDVVLNGRDGASYINSYPYDLLVLDLMLPQIPGIFEAVGVGAIVDIPFDPVIARGTAIDTRALSRPSRLAWTRLAAAVATNIRTR